MFAKFGNAILLLGSNVLLFSAIIFTIRLPANVVVNYPAYRENVDELTLIAAAHATDHREADSEFVS